MRFTLVDTGKREFAAERMCFSARVDDWIDIHCYKPLGDLARTLIRTLGTDEFFELF